MARLTHTSITAVPPSQADKGGPITAHAFRSAAKNLSLVYDKVTGENACTTTLIHEGGGSRGCPLNMPLANQWINANIGAITGAGIDSVDVIVVPIYLPTGWETKWIIEIDSIEAATSIPQVEVRNSSWTVTYGPNDGSPVYRDVSQDDESFDDVFGYQFRFNLTAGALQYVIIRKNVATYSAAVTSDIIYSWRMYPNIILTTPVNTMANEETNYLNQYDAQSTLTTSNWIEFDDTDIEDGGPLSAFVVANLNYMSNTLQELITGAPLPGNQTKQVTQNINNDRAIFTSEPLIKFPIGAVAFGGAVAATAALKPVTTPMNTTPTAGLTQWSRFPTAHTTTNVLIGATTWYLPDFDTSPSAFQCYMIFQAANSDALGNWSVAVQTAAGLSSFVALSQIGATVYWQAKITAIPFTAGASNYCEIYMKHTANAALSHEVLVLGAFFDFNS